MTGKSAPARDAMAQALREYGPMTRHDLAEHLEWPTERVKRTLLNARRAHPGQVFRVVGYRRAAEGDKGKDSSLYAAEAGQDTPRAARPDKRLKASQKRKRDRRRALINVRARAGRARAAGRTAQASPWAMLGVRA